MSAYNGTLTFGSLFSYLSIDETTTPFRVLYRGVTILNTVNKDVVRGSQFSVAILDTVTGTVTFYNTLQSFSIHLT